MSLPAWLAGLSLLPAMMCAQASCAEASTVWLDVPFVKQEANGCGAAAIAMLMRYWSREDADPQKIYQALYSREHTGFAAAMWSASCAPAAFRHSCSAANGRISNCILPKAGL